MIQKILSKKKCCGCRACEQCCAKHSINMQKDEEGFLYPIVNKTTCVDCGLCEKVCPVLNPFKTSNTAELKAAISRNEHERLNSSSGGVFTLFADKILSQGGIVFGAKFNEEWLVEINYIKSKDNIYLLQKSKYIQADTKQSFSVTAKFLKEGKKVLYSGTPCQIAGLRHYLRKDYDNLLTVDIVCHGVPSPLIWYKYLGAIESSIKVDSCKYNGKNTVLPSRKFLSSIKDINFREKSEGWKKFRFDLHLSKPIEEWKNSVLILHNKRHYENPYMKLFLQDISLRPSCYECPANNFRSGSDITLGDFWGINRINNSLDDDKGTSAIILNTEKGKEFIKDLNMICKDADIQQFIKKNPCLTHSVVMPKSKREKLYQYEGDDFLSFIKQLTKLSMKLRLKRFAGDILRFLNLR